MSDREKLEGMSPKALEREIRVNIPMMSTGVHIALDELVRRLNEAERERDEARVALEQMRGRITRAAHPLGEEMGG